MGKVVSIYSSLHVRIDIICSSVKGFRTKFCHMLKDAERLSNCLLWEFK